MIRLDGVTKTYPDGTTAVDDLSLVAPKGRITALVGPSGCGKTTTLRMINRMIEPTSGSVTIDGQDVLGMDAAELRRGIGYVIQHGGLFPHHTVERNVATVPLLLGTSRREAIARARYVSPEPPSITLLSMVGRLLQSDGGTIAVGGQDITSTPSRRIAQTLSILRQ